MLTTTIIIDKRKELPIKYKKALETETNAVVILSELNIALKFIQNNEPDLIIISDSIDEDLASFCSKIRVLTYNMRPVIIALSKSAEIEDKLKILENGSDDFLSEPVNFEEFKVRMKAHLRRQFESYSDNKTKLPDKNYSLRTIKRILHKNTDWGALLVKIENYYEYQKIYSELATDKLIQTFTAIIISALDKSDFLGSISENEFLILSSAVKIEKIAPFLAFAFDSICPKFYSKEDIERVYLIISGDENEGRRIEFVATTIGGITNETKEFDDAKSLLTTLQEIRTLSKKNSLHSNYLIHRTQIAGKNSVLSNNYNRKILVLEEDESLALLIKTALELKNYEVTDNNLTDPKPAVIILDAGSDTTQVGLEICKQLKSQFNAPKLIVTSIYHDKEAVLNAGADLYLPKPYNINDLIKWIDIFVKEINY